MDMEEIPELNLGGSSSSSSCEALESEQKNMGTQRISVSDHINAYQYSDHINAYQYSAEEADSFVIDMDSFSSSINKDSTNANSRITLQRSLSRKGFQRGGERKVNGNVTLHDKDTVPTTCSPKASLAGSCNAEKSAVVAVGSTNTQVHHQITITASNMCSTTTTTESKCVTRRNSFKRPSWLLDPKRILLFFATLSSMGTILLIYFTLTMSKQNADEYGSDWPQ